MMIVGRLFWAAWELADERLRNIVVVVFVIGGIAVVVASSMIGRSRSVVMLAKALSRMLGILDGVERRALL